MNDSLSRKTIMQTLCNCNTFPPDHTSCPGLLQSNCKTSGFCRISRFNEEQTAYVLSDLNKDIYLKACPGSGKTEVIGAKAAFEMKQWSTRNRGIAVLTFTNSAEDELYKRISLYLGHEVRYPHFLGTFTSWLHGYIANPFLSLITGYHNENSQDSSLRLVESNCSSGFLSAYQTKRSFDKLGPIKANEFYFDIEKSRESNKNRKAIFAHNSNGGKEKEAFDTFLKDHPEKITELKDLKEKFWEDGFVNYEDVEYLTYKLLHQNQTITEYAAKRFPVILIDECQDLSYSELGILWKLHKKGVHLHLIGDLDQSIYGFREIEPAKTKAFISKVSMKEMPLSENYRSCPAIVNASLAVLMKPIDSVKTNISQKADKPLIAILYKHGEESRVVKKFEEILQKEHFSIEESRVIVRNRNLKETIMGRKYETQRTANAIEDFAKFIFLQNCFESVEEYQESLQVLARAILRTFFRGVPHQSEKHLFKPEQLEAKEWRKIILKVKEELLSAEDLQNLDTTWSEWKKLLGKVVKEIENSTLSSLSKGTIKLDSLRKESGAKNIKSQFMGHQSIPFSCSVETIHSCKGMSLDAVLFMSSYMDSSSKGSGTYWKNWFAESENKVDEKNRLAYVAFSRARHLLALGIPNPPSSPVSEAEKAKLREIGFEILTIS